MLLQLCYFVLSGHDETDGSEIMLTFYYRCIAVILTLVQTSLCLVLALL